MRKAFAKLHAAKSMSANVTTTFNGPDGKPMTFKGTVKAAKPNLFRWDMTGTGAMTFVADGMNYYQTSVGSPYFFRSPLDKNPQEMSGMWEGEVDAFFGGPAKLADIKTTYLGTTTVGGVTCDLVKAEYKAPDRTVTFAIGQSDSLIRRAEIRMALPAEIAATLPADQRESVQTNELSNIVLNAAIAPTVFAWKAPEGQKLFEQPDYSSKLVPVGQPAPDWTLPGPNGETVSLSDALKGKKALLVNFWFYG